MKNIQKILPLVSLVLGLLLLFSGFFTALTIDGNSIMSGMKAILVVAQLLSVVFL